MRQPQIFADKKNSIVSSTIGTLPSVETMEDYEAGLSHMSNSDKIVDISDHIHAGNLLTKVPRAYSGKEKYPAR